MQTREEIEERITEAFLGFQRGKSREAMIVLLANYIEQFIKEDELTTEAAIVGNTMLADDKTRSGAICEKCENDVNEVFMCERCEMMICDKCSATYNQFTQIDYTCCKGCGGQD